LLALTQARLNNALQAIGWFPANSLKMIEKALIINMISNKRLLGKSKMAVDLGKTPTALPPDALHPERLRVLNRPGWSI
jgi:hypothetical protein